MRRLYLLLLALALCYYSADGFPESDSTRLQIKGYIKSLTQLNKSTFPDTLLSGELLHQRTSIEYQVIPQLVLRTDVRTRLFYGKLFEQAGFREGLSDNSELINTDHYIIDNEDLLLLLQIDRAFLDYQGTNSNVRIGEQRINWGTNLVWNPNDIFNTYNILDFDYEERNGVQAIRLQYQPDDRKVIELTGAPGKDSSSIFGCQYKTNYKTYDLQFSAGTLYQQPLIGAGWAGNIGTVGCKGELNYYFKQPRKEQQFIASGTLDYTTNNRWYIYTSILFQEKKPAATAFSTYNQRNSTTAKFLMPGHWSFYVGSLKELSPLTAIQLAVVYSDYNNSLIVFPTFSYSAGKNLELLSAFQCIFDNQQTDWQYEGIAGFLRLKYSF